MVLYTEPEPSFRQKVESVIEGKKVRLATIKPAYLNNQKKSITGEPSVQQNLNDLQPLDMLKNTFLNKYQSPLPENFEQMFGEVLRTLN